MQDERVSLVVRELAAAGAQQAHSRIGDIASVLGITDEAKLNEIAILVGAAILQAYQDGNGATLNVDALIANVVAGIVATEEREDETDDGEITTVQPELVEVRAPGIWTGHLVDFLDLNELDLDEVPEVLAADFRLGLPGEDGGAVTGSHLYVVEVTGPNASKKAAPQSEIYTVRVSFWGTLEDEVESGTPTEISGTPITNFRFENVN